MSGLNHVTEKEKEELLKLVDEVKLNLVRNYYEGCKEILGIDRANNGHLIENELKKIDENLYNVYMRKKHHGH